MPLHLYFFYSTIVLLPTQLGKHFFPDWALILGRRVDYVSPTLFLTDITIILTLFFWFLNQCMIHRLRFTKKLLCVKEIFIFLFFCTFIIFNSIFASSPLIALYKWTKVIEFVIFGLYIIKTKPSLPRTIWCLSFAVFYSSVIAIAQFLIQHSVGGFLWFLGERTFDVTTPGIAKIQLLVPSYFSFISQLRTMNQELLRPYSTFSHPNVLGGFLAVTLPLIILSNGTKKLFHILPSVVLQYFRVTTIILGYLALILTFSRSAWIAGLSGLGYIWLYHHHKIRIHWIIGLLALITFVVFSLPYFQSLISKNESVFVRNELTSAAVFIWSISPVIGVGLGNFLVRLPDYYPHRDIFFLQPVHNIYLLVLVETGLIGLCSCMYFLWKLFYHKSRKRLFVVCQISCIILFLLGAVDHYPFTLQQGQLLVTILASNAYLSSASD